MYCLCRLRRNRSGPRLLATCARPWRWRARRCSPSRAGQALRTAPSSASRDAMCATCCGLSVWLLLWLAATAASCFPGQPKQPPGSCRPAPSSAWRELHQDVLQCTARRGVATPRTDGCVEVHSTAAGLILRGRGVQDARWDGGPRGGLVQAGRWRVLLPCQSDRSSSCTPAAARHQQLQLSGSAASASMLTGAALRPARFAHPSPASIPPCRSPPHGPLMSGPAAAVSARASEEAAVQSQKPFSQRVTFMPASLAAQNESHECRLLAPPCRRPCRRALVIAVGVTS